jgi:hypothetical protein
MAAQAARVLNKVPPQERVNAAPDSPRTAEQSFYRTLLTTVPWVSAAPSTPQQTQLTAAPKTTELTYNPYVLTQVS